MFYTPRTSSGNIPQVPLKLPAVNEGPTGLKRSLLPLTAEKSGLTLAPLNGAGNLYRLLANFGCAVAALPSDSALAYIAKALGGSRGYEVDGVLGRDYHAESIAQ